LQTQALDLRRITTRDRAMAPKKRASADTSPNASKRTKVAKVVPAVILSDDEVEPPKSKSKVKAKGKDAKSVVSLYFDPV